MRPPDKRPLDRMILREQLALHVRRCRELPDYSQREWSEKVIYARMDRLVYRGFLEFGTSLRSAWLTDEGKAYLAGLEAAEQPDGAPCSS